VPPGKQADILSLSLSLSVSNLAGGVGGGMAHIPVLTAAACAFAASVLFLAFGQFVGSRIGRRLPDAVLARISASLFFSLAVVSALQS
jgi:putative Mn2+ efflux pump MntP